MSEEDEPRLRWSFTAITPASFVWTSEVSRDSGDWIAEERMLASRRLSVS